MISAKGITLLSVGAGVKSQRLIPTDMDRIQTLFKFIFGHMVSFCTGKIHLLLNAVTVAEIESNKLFIHYIYSWLPWINSI